MSGKGINIQLSQQGVIPLQVEFECGSGEILVIVGPSGSGKSTILRSICGLYTPAHGNISANGSPWLDTEKGINVPVQQRKIGMVFQQYALFPHLTAVENIAIALSKSSTAGKKERAQSLLALMNMEGLEDRLPHQLSGGQQQRVAVARALARDPAVLLLDEPFSALDQQTRRKLVRELLRLRRQIQIPVIHVTHNLNEARRIADRICILHHGKTLQVDTPRQVMSRPLDANVAHLIGHYNIFSCEVAAHDEQAGITWINWHNYRLEAGYQPEIEPGSICRWVIPTENVIVHRRDRPSRGERENPVQGQITEFIELGETASCKIHINDEDAIYTSISTHAAKRNNLAEGQKITVSLLAEGIHLMPGPV